MRDPGWSDRLRQGDLLNKDSAYTHIGSGENASQAKALAMGPWTRGEVGMKPGMTSAPPPYVGNRPFTELRSAAPEAFAQWGDQFFGKTNLGNEFMPPPPEPVAEASTPSKENNSGS